MEIADWVYVMRHGKMIGCVAKKDTSPEELTRMMVDHALEKFEKAACHPGEVALSLSGLSYTNQDHAPVLRDVNLEIREGEIYGLAGIEGNGQQELVEVLSGIESRWTGTYRLLGQNVAGKSVRALIDLGLGCIHSDRHDRGLLLDLPAAKNVLLGPVEGEKSFMVNAINETLKEEFRRNPDTFIWGQDVANKDKGGVFNVTKGMQQEFGDARVFSAPIAEDYIVGTANGMCRFDPKIHVVIEGAEFADYFWPAVEQYVECTHEYWRSNGKFTPNITLRLASGGYIGGGLYHSQNLEGALTTLPGARIVCPSFADDAAGLLRTSMRSKGFTLYLEPKALYNSVEAAAVVPEEFEVPFGKARIRREGTDLTVVTYGNTTHFCLNVAERLAQEGLGSVEVIDLRSLIPLDKEAIFASVQKTGKVLVVHEDKVFSGFGAEIAAQIAEEMFRYLDAPVQRIGSTFTPVGFNPILERAILPNDEKIYKAAKELLEF